MKAFLRKKMSLKFKIALWFTFILSIVCIVFIMLSVTIYSASEESQRKRTLKAAVDDQAMRIEKGSIMLWGLIEADGNDYDSSMHDFYKNDVVLMAYFPDGSHAGGLFLYKEFDDIPYVDSSINKASFGGKSYYYYDVPLKGFSTHGMWIRGVIATENGMISILSRYPLLFIGLLVLLILAFLGGYFITAQFLSPIRRISNTAKEIRGSNDLTKRIDIEPSGDEISELCNSFNEMFIRLEKNVKAETQFTSNASHELRTPISIVLAQCEYALENADSKDEVLDTVVSIQKQGYRMSALVESLLMFTRIEQGTDRYPKAPTDLVPIIRSSCEDFRLIDTKNTIISETLPTMLVTDANPELFRLLINNLIQNALRYGKENGHVDITLFESNNRICLSVKDDGIGISKEDLPHIFEQFYRSDSSRSSNGMGLGLSLVKSIAHFHNGDISVNSTKNEGSEFVLTLYTDRS